MTQRCDLMEYYGQHWREIAVLEDRQSLFVLAVIDELNVNSLPVLLNHLRLDDAELQPVIHRLEAFDAIRMVLDAPTESGSVEVTPIGHRILEAFRAIQPQPREVSNIPDRSTAKPALAEQPPDQWEEFIRKFHTVIMRAVFRAARGRITKMNDIEDLVQEVYLKLAQQGLSQFSDMSFEKASRLLSVFATKQALDSQRSQALKHERLDLISPVESTASAPPTERQNLSHEIERLLDSTLSGPHRLRDWRIFWLYYRRGMSAREIASIPEFGLSLKGVESVVQRLTKLVRQDLNAEFGQEKRAK